MELQNKNPKIYEANKSIKDIDYENRLKMELDSDIDDEIDELEGRF